GSVRVGGDKFDEAIINYIRRNYGMLIGEPTAESIKKSIGSAFPGSEVKEMEVKGRNLSEGVPRSFTISSNEILEALTDPLNQMVRPVKNALEPMPLGTLDRTPPPFFRQGHSALTKLVFFSGLAVFLMVADTRFKFGEPLRSAIAVVLLPVQRTLGLPFEAGRNAAAYLRGLGAAQ